MNKKLELLKMKNIVMLFSMVMLLVCGAFAWRGHGGGWGPHYYYHAGRYYQPGWFGIDYVVTAPPVGAVFTTLPDGCSTFIIGGAPYYYYGNTYFRYYPVGYVVVDPPMVKPVEPQTANPVKAAEHPVKSSDSAIITPAKTEIGLSDTVMINVPNSTGGYSPVKLVRHNDGYSGPQGEFYQHHPTVAQLKALYGN